ncbi:MAG: hypothetical protein UV38_C0003G0048 [candidate division TM6 bacterium GW2011_GWE2_42_60]|nr:MAG: hypothetical protein UV38_C0003G0048 [candidate division TM6 bacterium GW2011_GWE2_42_60]HBY05471.1 hypothetical protein [Candidatus Dependentiae bacterium]
MKAFLKGMQRGVTLFFVLLFSVLSPEFLRARASEPEKKSEHSPVQAMTRHTESESFDDPHIKEKMQRSEELVNRAAAHFAGVSLAKGCRDFETDLTWKRGELEIFIFGERGECYLHGNDAHDIWRTFGKKAVAKKDELSDESADGKFQTLIQEQEYVASPSLGVAEKPFVDEMLTKGASGGWVSYDWENGAKFAYVKIVEKDGYQYIIGTGFYPDSAAFFTQQIVREAINFAKRNGAAQLFQQVNNPRGPFVRGDWYLWVYDMEGNAFAHGRNIAYVGQNRLEWKDSRGGFRNRTMIRLVRDRGRGWVEYEEDGVLKRAYVEGFVDPRTGRQFIVGSGYYPDVNNDTIRGYVKSGISYLKSMGADVAFRDFSSYAGKFIRGPLRLFVYDLEGTILADAENPTFLGQNLINIRDAEGKFVVKEILKVAKTEKSGWITFFDKRAYKTIYVEYVEVPDGKYIVGAGYWPATKEFLASTLAEKAVSQLTIGDAIESMNMFTKTTEDFLRGDLFVTVYSEDGICLVSGTDRERIWFDEKKILDDKGYPVVDTLISTAKQGGGWVLVSRSGYPYRAYVKEVKKPIIRVAQKESTEEREKEEEILAFEEKVETLRGPVVDKQAPEKSTKPMAEKQSVLFTVSVGYFV